MSMTNKEKAAVRSDFYSEIDTVLSNMAGVVDSESTADGLLFHLDNGGFVGVTVTVKDETKFSLEKVRAEYAEKCARSAERAEKARLAAEEAERKAVEKAAKAAEKAATKEDK